MKYDPIKKAQVAKFIKDRNQALERDDLAWAAALLPMASSPRVVEIAFHKARAECTDVSKPKRDFSKNWLKENGYGPTGRLGPRSFPQ